MRARNTNIPKSRLGIRLPHESPSIGDGYAASGACTVRQMTDEERERYGQPAPRPEWMIKNEEANMDKEANFDEKLNKEKYLELKNSGLSDAKILHSLGFAYNSNIHILTKRKREWFKDHPAPRLAPGVASTKNEQEAPPLKPLMEYGWTARKIEVEPQEDEVTFIVPRKQKEAPIVRFWERGISLNVHAYRTLSPCRYVKIGTIKNGVIVLVKSDTSEGAFVVGEPKGGGVKIGGGALVDGLKKAGLEFGYYPMTYNEQKDRYEAS